jgi:ubiquinol-cytochrome c reductase cytochrome c1 subunit
MKELKILAIIAAFVGFTYYGIEPYAHHIMHPEVAPADFTFNDLKNVDTSIKGDAANGKALVEANCMACHSLKADGYEPMMADADAAAAYGVTPPDLSMAGTIYDINFLANFIFDPVTAMDLKHKYPVDGTKVFPMPAYNWMSSSDIMDMVAYLKSVAPKEIANTKEAKGEVFEAACGRCHDIGYAGMTSSTPKDIIKTYMGSNPPDLSMYIISRGEHYLHTFINKPQANLHGTAMPRVGLTQEAQEDVIKFMELTGDSKKAEREELGPKVLLYLLVFAIFAYLWKRQIWKDVH